MCSIWLHKHCEPHQGKRLETKSLWVFKAMLYSGVQTSTSGFCPPSFTATPPGVKSKSIWWQVVTDNPPTSPCWQHLARHETDYLCFVPLSNFGPRSTLLHTWIKEHAKSVKCDTLKRVGHQYEDALSMTYTRQKGRIGMQHKDTSKPKQLSLGTMCT